MTTPVTPKQFKTFCIGRLLVDLPADFEQTLGSDVELTYGVDKSFRRTKVQLIQLRADLAEFNSAVAKQSAELRSLEHSRSPTKSMLASMRNVDADTVLLRAYDEPGMVDYFKALVIAKKSSSIALFTSSINKGDNAETIERELLTVLSKSSFHDNLPVPGAKGACFGPLLIDAGQDGETMTVAFKATRMPDVTLSFDINSLGSTSDGGLFKRLEKKSGLLAQAGIGPNGYRKRTVAIGDRAAEEVFRSGKERDHSIRQFVAEVVMNKPASLIAPLIAINLSMGGQVGPNDYRDASMSEPEAMAMWDAILKSVRLRPGAV